MENNKTMVNPGRRHDYGATVFQGGGKMSEKSLQIKGKIQIEVLLSGTGARIIGNGGKIPPVISGSAAWVRMSEGGR